MYIPSASTNSFHSLKMFDKRSLNLVLGGYFLSVCNPNSYITLNTSFWLSTSLQ